MNFLIEHLPERVAKSAVELGIAKRGKDKVPSNLAKLLTRPLFDSIEPDESAILPDEPPVIVEAFEFAELESEPSHLEWTLDGVLKLHSVLLEESLKALAGRGNGEQKREILEWIFEPDLVGTITRNGREVPVFTWQVPCSFAFCCKLEGMDPETIRNQVLTQMPAEARRFFH